VTELAPVPRSAEASTGAPGTRVDGRAHVLRTPVAVLTLIVGASAALRALVSLGVASVWILPDEVVYSELAKSIAAGDRPAVRGVPAFGWGEIYPTLVAPAWALFDDPVWAYHAALVLNAVLMSSAAVPAYFLARYYVSERSSLLVALMTVLVPSLAHTGVVMTENAAYPAFVLALLLITRSVVSPTLVNQGLALAGLGIVFFTRIQGAALGGAYLVAIVAYAFTGPPSERLRYLRRFAPTAVLTVVPPFAVVAFSVQRGRGASGWLGSKSDTFEGFPLPAVPQWFAYRTGELVLYTAVVPMAAAAIVVGKGLGRRRANRPRLFAVIAVPTFLAMVGSVSIVSAALDVDGTENLNERYVFYVVPLAFIALALWVELALPRPRVAALAAVAACCALTIVIPIPRLDYNAAFQSVGLLPWIGLSDSRLVVAVAAGIFTAAAGGLWLRCRPERVGRLWLLVILTMTFTGLLAVGANAFSASNSAYAFDGRSMTWVDDAVPAGEQVAVLWDERLARPDSPDPFYSWVMATEFYNPSVGTVYRLGPETYYENFLPTVAAVARPDGTLAPAGGDPLTPRYVLTTCRSPVDGTVVARAPRGSLQLVEVEGPLRIADRRPCTRRIP
jgi:hypothetical protein